MSETEDTIKQNGEILQAIADLSKKIDDYKKDTDNQLETIREGISFNASRFDRIEAQIYKVQSDISNLKADVRDLGEEIRRDKLALK